MRLAFLLLLPLTVFAAERDYQLPWCASQGGKPVSLPDGTFADCVTATHAIEVDFAPKWAEAIGQSLHYARVTQKRPGVLLIVGATEAHLRLRATISGACLPIDVWTVPR
jgi:hypothetical protein